MNIKRSVLAATYTAALMSSGNSEAAQQFALEQSPKQAAQTTFEGAKRYWAAQDLAHAATKLVILPPNESFDCDYGHRTVHIDGDDAMAFYCPSPDAIVTTEKHFNTPTLPGQKDEAARFMVLHEYGHAIDSHNSNREASTTMKDYEQNPVPHELRATRLAGRAAAHVLSDFAQTDIEQYLGLQPDKTTWAHGPRSAHQQAFTHGLREES